MKRLLVGSVFANDSEDQSRWLDLQLRFLDATTESYDHVTVVSEGVQTGNFESRTSVLTPENTNLRASLAHLQGLRLLLDYFRAHQTEYEHFLFLDADAFPIRTNWMGTLLNKMQAGDRFDEQGAALPLKAKWRDYEIACALRSENLETRLHASILFVKGPYLEHVDFETGAVGADLAGNLEDDIYLPIYQNERRNMALPLIRTNKTNVHPLACGVYLDMFYHHACGSGRPFNLRAADFYLQKIVQPLEDVSGFTRKLMASPNDFVANLAGWNPVRYGKI